MQFRYSISDGRSDPVPGAVVVSVSNATSVDQAPVLRPDILELRAGHTAPVRVLLNDYDPEGGPLRVVGVAEAPNATLRVGPGGQEIYVSVAATATTGFSFGYDVVDEAGNRNASFVQVRLVPVGEANRPPIARPDVARTRDRRRRSRSPCWPTTAIPTATRYGSSRSSPSRRSARRSPTPTAPITYTPIGDVTGTDRLRYVVVDAFGDRAIGEVLVGVIAGRRREPSAERRRRRVHRGRRQRRRSRSTSRPTTTTWTATASTSPVPTGPRTRSACRDPRTHVLFQPPATVPAGAETTGIQVSFTYDVVDGRGGTDRAVATVTVVAALQPVAADRGRRPGRAGAPRRRR